MRDKEDVEKFGGDLACLSLVLIIAVGAIAGGTLILSIGVRNKEGRHEPMEIHVGGPLGQEHEYGELFLSLSLFCLSMFYLINQYQK